MVKPAPANEVSDWREDRRQSARDAIVDAAWGLVAEEGLAGLSLRDLARRAGITPPTVYAYFESKNAIYDAMFGRAATQFVETMAEPLDCEDSRDRLLAYVRRFVDFCTSDTPRYQLLFQRTLPGFEPSPESYAPTVRALSNAREMLATNAITEERHVDLWTALVNGWGDQQVSNDPGGDRWTRLIEESIDMLVAHCQMSGNGGTSRTRTHRGKERPS
jgi:AcrR family transcriptional regulator